MMWLKRFMAQVAQGRQVRHFWQGLWLIGRSSRLGPSMRPTRRKSASRFPPPYSEPFLPRRDPARVTGRDASGRLDRDFGRGERAPLSWGAVRARPKGKMASGDVGRTFPVVGPLGCLPTVPPRSKPGRSFAPFLGRRCAASRSGRSTGTFGFSTRLPFRASDILPRSLLLVGIGLRRLAA